MNKALNVVIHLVLLALVLAIGAYWAVRILTPQPTAAPPPMAVPPPRDPDPVASARMFGLVQMAVAVVSNIQVAGVFAAGKDSAAILVVDGKPPRAFVIGQEVTSGTTLVEVGRDAITLQGIGGRQELRAPARPMSAPLPTSGPAAPAPAFARQGNTLSASGGSAGQFSGTFNSPRPAPFVPGQPRAPTPPRQPMEPEPDLQPGSPPPQATPPVAQ